MTNSIQSMRRYSRHTILPQLGEKAQKAICSSSVVVIGAGGLGVTVLQSLVGAGVGTISIIDNDTVSLSNLHRQVLYKESDQGQYKADVAKRYLQGLNSNVKIEVHKARFDVHNATDFIRSSDVVADCTDNMDSRYTINDFCVASGKVLVSAAAIGLEGHLSVYGYQKGPCLRCLFPEKSPRSLVGNCDEAGVLGVVPNIMGGLQALEILKILGGFGEPLSSKILYFDALCNKFNRIVVSRKKCSLCVKSEMNDTEGLIREVKELNDVSESCNGKIRSITCDELFHRLEEKKKPFVLVDVRPHEYYEKCHLEQSINVPAAVLQEDRTKFMATVTEKANVKSGEEFDLYIMCMKGITSKMVCDLLNDLPKQINVFNVSGGMECWKREIDPEIVL